MNITDLEIQAYVDGELAPGDAARIEAAVAADVLVAARVGREMRLRAQVRGAFAPVLDEPVPERLQALLRGVAGDGASPAGAADTVVPLRRASRGGRWRAPVYALAASVAVLAVSMWMRPAAGPVELRDGALVARGELARGLDQALASAPEANARTSIALTFRDANGSVCRSFSHAGVGAGLACRDGTSWSIEVLSRGAGEVDGPVRQAAAEMPAAVQAAVDTHLAGDVFDARQERLARDSGWR